MDREARLSELRAGDTPTVIGLGAIGSWVARWLMANGIDFHGFDDDVVATKNLASAAFESSDVGRHKARVLGGYVRRWSAGENHIGPILSCADHGPTRREAAGVAAHTFAHAFYCAKANGSDWQVWTVTDSMSLNTFVAFDVAAEADPVRTPCGDSSVGRVASLGAAAEILSAWSGLDVTPAEVEASFGAAFDPALAFALARRWDSVRGDAEAEAQEAAEAAFKDAIDTGRERSDASAIRELRELREDRAAARHRLRSSIHARAIAELDRGESVRDAARIAVRGPVACRFSRLATIAAGIEARRLQANVSVPDSVTIESAVAS